MSGVVNDTILAKPPPLWIPAFAGMTVVQGPPFAGTTGVSAVPPLWVPAFAGTTWGARPPRACGFRPSRERRGEPVRPAPVGSGLRGNDVGSPSAPRLWVPAFAGTTWGARPPRACGFRPSRERRGEPVRPAPVGSGLRGNDVGSPSAPRLWVPAFAGTTWGARPPRACGFRPSRERRGEPVRPAPVGSGLRGNDVGSPSAPRLWVPAFAGTTWGAPPAPRLWVPAFAGTTDGVVI